MSRRLFSVWLLLMLMSSATAERRSINVLPLAMKTESTPNREFVKWELVAYYRSPSDGKRFQYRRSWPGSMRTLFDGSLHTSFNTKPRMSRYDKVAQYFQHRFPYKVKVASYKIFVPEDSPKAKYPRSWIVWGGKLNREDRTYETSKLHQVNYADFGRVYTGQLADPGAGYDRIGIEIRGDNSPEDPELDVKMAEVRYFGPKNQFSKHIRGGLNCKRAPQYLKEKQLKDGTSFSNDRLSYPLRKNFDNKGSTGRKFNFPPAAEDPLIVGIIFPSPTEVLQFLVQTKEFFQKGIVGLGLIVLEGNKCDPSCNELGVDGWELLARGDEGRHYANKWLVKYPGAYKAYRAKIFRSPTDNGATKSIYLEELFLMVCR